MTKNASAVAVASNTSHRRACDATCTTQGRTGTCRSHILAAAKHRHNEMDACVAAYYWVQAQCPVCTACMFSDAGCTMPRPTQAMPQPFNCSADLSTWKSSWSVIKKYWCCRHQNHGCMPQQAPAWRRPAFDCNEGSAWSPGEHAWCCRHKRLGCSHKTSSTTATATTTPVSFARIKVASGAPPIATTTRTVTTAAPRSNIRNTSAGATIATISATIRNITTSATAAIRLVATTHTAALPDTTTTTSATQTSTPVVATSIGLPRPQ